MTAPWPTSRARAWLLRAAADHILEEAFEQEAGRLAQCALYIGAESEEDFRATLKDVLSWRTEDVDSAVACVYYTDRKRRMHGTVPRAPGCRCQWEEGDSPCPVHGDEE